MQIFVYEYASAQHPSMPLPASIRREGRVMLDAALADFNAIPGVTTSTLLECDGMEDVAFEARVKNADWTFIVAPELARAIPRYGAFNSTREMRESVLEQRCRWV